GGRPLPVYELLPHSGGDQTRRAPSHCLVHRKFGEQSKRRSAGMSKALTLPRALERAIRNINPSASRRDFLKSSGALVLTCGMGTLSGGQVLAQAAGSGLYPDPDYLELDTWIVIHPDNSATFYVGKTDGGQGTGTAFRQMM